MEYLLDITDELVLDAMAALGIRKEDIRVKTIKDFDGEDISKDIQDIRYNHYLSKSAEFVKLVQDYLIEQENAEQFEEPSQPTQKYTVDVMRAKHDQRILKLFEKEKLARIMEDEAIKKSKRQRKTEKNQDIKKKKEDINKKHQEKLKQILMQRKIEEDSVLERINRSAVSRAKNKTSQKEKKIFNLTLDDKEISQKLEEFDRKILKSSQNHTRNLNEKVENLRSHLRRRNTLEDSNDFEQKVLVLSSRLNSAFTRRRKIQSELREKMQEKESKFLEKSEKMKKISELEVDKSLEIEKSDNDEKFRKILVNIKKKKPDEVKAEKLKNIQASIHEKINNLKKIEFSKKEKIIEKHQMLEKKQQEHKLSLEIANKTIRDKAMSFTIEKEKGFEIKYLLAKSKGPDDLQKLLEKYKTNL